MGDVFSFQVQSSFLSRHVKVDVYEKKAACPSSPVALLLINDGQDLPSMGFADVLEKHVHSFCRLICVGIHAGRIENRSMAWQAFRILCKGEQAPEPMQHSY